MTSPAPAQCTADRTAAVGIAPAAAELRPPPALVTRQPIFDASLEVAAYELLHGPEDGPAAGPGDATLATGQVLAGAILDIGLRRLAGDLPAFIRFPVDLLVKPLQLPLAPDRIIIGVSRGSACDGYLIEGLMRMRGEGYRIALDDFDPRRDGAEMLDYADIVKVDVQRHAPAQLAQVVRELRRGRVQLVAMNVATGEDLARCRELGFELFHGSFLERPETFSGRRAPSSRLAALELVHTLQDCSISAVQVETSIARDAGLSYRLLHCINSSYYRTPRAVGSLLQAILLLGYDEVRRICSVILLSSLDDRPAYVAVQALTRARMCENLCVKAGLAARGGYFMTGLLSLLDVILGAPLEECLRELPLADPVREALQEQRGSLGAALRCVIGHERGDWESARFEGIPPQQISTAYAQAVEWAESVHAALGRHGATGRVASPAVRR